MFTATNTLNRSKLLTEAEVSELMRSLKRRCRDELLIELALRTGARASELLALRVQDFHLETSEVYIRASKNSNDRSIVIPADLAHAIVSQTLPGKRCFNITYDRLWQVWQRYTPGKKFHALRHTFATKVYEKTKDIRLVQVLLGHKSITNTLIYAHFVDGRNKMKGALDELY